MKCATCDWIISPADSSADTTIGEVCTCCAFDLLRWRKWPDESPDSWRHYMVMTDLSWPVIAFYTGEYFRIHSEIVVGVTHWRPIGPLPGGE